MKLGSTDCKCKNYHNDDCTAAQNPITISVVWRSLMSNHSLLPDQLSVTFSSVAVIQGSKMHGA